MDKEIVKEIISKADFWKYESCRRSGLTNMCDLPIVEILTKLPRDKIILILQNYKILKEKYINKEKNE